MKCFWIFTLFLIINVPMHAHELSICTMFKDDSKYLPEWIEFHEKRGVEHFYLYNNGSKDNPEGILKPYIERDLVTLIDWNYSHEDQGIWNAIQVNANMDCVYRIRETDKWCAFIDTDEFLFSPLMNDLREVLKNYETNSGIMVYWRCYGTSGISKVPDNEKMLNVLTHRGSDDNPWNKFHKSVMQPKYVNRCPDPHNFFCDYIDRLDMKNSVEILRINHYWSRDMDFFRNIKIPRSIKWHPHVEDYLSLERTFNEIYDPILSDK